MNTVYAKVRGPSSPLTAASDIQPLDNTAFLVDGKWTAEIVISAFDRADERRAQKIEEEVLSIIGQSGKISWDRVKYFLAIPKKNITVDLREVSNTQVFRVGPTEYNGIMAPEVPFPTDGKIWAQNSRTEFEIVPPKDFPDKRSFTTVFAEETGYGIISGECFQIRNHSL